MPETAIFVNCGQKQFMRKTIAKKLISILFLSIFMSKMVISVAPLIKAHLDCKTVNAVIMQLEIEHSKPSDGKEFSAKDFISLNLPGISISSPLCMLDTGHVHTDQDKHVQAFYPSVPTPPPNA